MKHKHLFLALALVSLAACQKQVTPNYTQFVDPLIGSGYHGHVFVGASVPFGMVQLGPSNLTQGWDWCSGYHYSDSTLIGFAHTHLSGTGIGDLGDILIYPEFTTPAPAGLRIGTYRHEREKVEPGYYSIVIDSTNILAELTATARVGWHRYTFPSQTTNGCLPNGMRLVMNLFRGIGWDAPVEAQVRLTSETTFEGYRFSKGWAEDQKIYFSGVFSLPVVQFENENPYYAAFDFDGTQDRVLEVKVALSYTGIEAATRNLRAESAGQTFDKVRAQATAAWNEQLSRVEFNTPSAERKKTFYTAMYHSMIAPSLFCDVEEDIPFTRYSVFSLWDTYRAANPWYTLVHPERVDDFINSFLEIYRNQGKLPVWHLVGNETNCMVGYHAVPVVADAYFKGFRGFDTALAYEACKGSALLDFRGLDWVKKTGYIPCDQMNESVAMALEYAIDDWCIAQMAKDMGHKEDYDYFSQRAKAYTYYFDKQTRFMRGRLTDGSWRTPFDPFMSLHRANDYVEGNAWQYTWLVPHDVDGLVDLFGSKEAFLNKLDSLFIVPSYLGEGASPDISGLIGQYAHGNEPSHSTLYLYAMVGEPDKTAVRVREVLDHFYSATPEGLIGNEDCGQMSAWYLFSALGFYPANAAEGVYWFGSPVMDRAVIHLPGGKTFTLTAHNNSEVNCCIKEIKLNGEPYTKGYITHQDLLNGGHLEYFMHPYGE